MSQVTTPASHLPVLTSSHRPVLRRVVYICADPGVPVFGRKGASVHVQEVIRAMRAQGLQVTLFAARVGGDAPVDLHDLPLVRLPEIPKGDLGARERAAIASNAELRMALRQYGPFDLAYERYSLWSDAGMAYADASATPAVLEVNAPLIEEQAQHRGLVHRAAAMQIARSAFRQATTVVAVSDAVAAHVRTVANGPVNVHVVPNGVNTTRFTPGRRPAMPAQQGVFTVGFVGTLKPWHGLPTLVRAFAQLHESNPNTRLLLVGDGTERERITFDLTQRGLLTATHFTGAVDPACVPALLASMDVAVAPYPALTDHYFSPLKLYEYMAAGVPVIASAVGQITAVIRDGHNGLLVPPDNDTALASAVARLRADTQLRTRLAQAARETVLQDRSWDAVVRRTLALVDDASARYELAAS